jgi:hypothetical protein
MACASRSSIRDIIEKALSSFLDKDNIRSCNSPVIRLHSFSLQSSAFSRLISSSGVIRWDRAGSDELCIFVTGGELSLSHEEVLFLRRLCGERSSMGAGATSCLS